MDALRLLKEEVQHRDPYWAGLVENWSGGGPDGSDDPCGNPLQEIDDSEVNFAVVFPLPNTPTCE